MAKYTVKNVEFQIENHKTFVKADLHKDGKFLQGIGFTVKKTTNTDELMGLVAAYVKIVIEHDAITSETFVNAKQKLEGTSWVIDD